MLNMYIQAADTHQTRPLHASSAQQRSPPYPTLTTGVQFLGRQNKLKSRTQSIHHKLLLNSPNDLQQCSWSFAPITPQSAENHSSVERHGGTVPSTSLQDGCILDCDSTAIRLHARGDSCCPGTCSHPCESIAWTLACCSCGWSTHYSTLHVG